ncbi:hotdog family protein [[Mycobacterium] crassicus]|uniref:AfsA-related hotdog domain-containing protein n=1 Tax=[Mycobacterium] crassicus TaxID=2872309 RepID=A0ABU5XHV0_9MYCO|nr:AfsA-related hotdog domain-containing protein [Mycolicibacter sp. MYC098]MEB3021342.1 AfsA-related hotdog domain-containing protein [Mycolicibacter sp. MYC098]
MIPGRTIDTLDLAPSGGILRGSVRVDLQDPVFFDHPLDHVPGMLLVVAGLEFAEHAAMLRPANVCLRLTFTKFCELDAPIEVSAARETDGNPIEFIQSGRNIARGLLGRRETALAAEIAPVPAFGDGTIPSDLVHRADPGNIAVGPLTVDAGRVWVRVREEAAIGGLPPRASAVASIIEAARQFVIAILHLWGRQPMGTKMIFVGLTADVPTTVPQGQLTRALSWQPTPPEQTRKLRIDVHAVGDRAIKVGSIVIASRCADEVEYARLRAG